MKLENIGNANHDPQEIFICHQHRESMHRVVEMAAMFSALPKGLLKQFPQDFFDKMADLAREHGRRMIVANDMALRMEKGLERREKVMKEKGLEGEYQEAKLAVDHASAS